MLNKEQIKEIIPQREPFLMIDEVEEYIPGESAVAYKYVNEEEWYFKGHFPGNPIMPGVLITESLAQAGAIAILSMKENKGKNALFGGIDKMKFKKMVTPQPCKARQTLNKPTGNAILFLLPIFPVFIFITIIHPEQRPGKSRNLPEH